MSTVIGVARVPAPVVGGDDTAPWPVLVQRSWDAGYAAGRAETTTPPHEWQGAREYATATVNDSELTEDAKRHALAVLDRLPVEVVEDVADELVEQWCSGWAEAARTDSYVELAELAAAFTRRVAEAGLVDGDVNLAGLAEQVQHLAQRVDAATTAEAILRRVDQPVDPEEGLRAALLRFYDAKHRENAAAYAEGMVDGATIANGVDPDTGEPFADPDRPAEGGDR